MYSTMAPDSQIEISPSSKTGTLPKGCLALCSSDLRSVGWNAILFSSYGNSNSSNNHKILPALEFGAK